MQADRDASGRGRGTARVPAAALALLFLPIACSPAGGDEDRAAHGPRVSGPGIAATAIATPTATASVPIPSPVSPEDLTLVSLSPVATRFLFALGVGARVIAVDPASQALSGLGRLPTTDLDGADHFDPDFILVPERPDAGPNPAADPRILEFAPHDLEDVYALCREIGIPLAGELEATELERRIARPLARVAGESSPDGRPGVVALLGLEPLTLAGGHSFETDLIEAAGGSSLTHGSDETRRVLEREDLRRMRPDLIVAASARALSSALQEEIVLAVGDIAPVVFFVFDRETFWLEEPAQDAQRLRALIAGFRPAAGSRRARSAAASGADARAPGRSDGDSTPTW